MFNDDYIKSLKSYIKAEIPTITVITPANLAEEAIESGVAIQDLGGSVISNFYDGDIDYNRNYKILIKGTNTDSTNDLINQLVDILVNSTEILSLSNSYKLYINQLTEFGKLEGKTGRDKYIYSITGFGFINTCK